MRVTNGLAPVDLSARPDYYEILTESPVTLCAKKYHLANQLSAKEEVTDVIVGSR